MLRAGSEHKVEPDKEQLQPNQGPTAFGKYQLFASLGRGGMADVFLAVARGPMGFNKLAVVKRLRTALAEEPSFLNMFLDEARLAARLNHPNVVHTYEVGEQNGAYFIAMEYLEGQSLNKIIKEASKHSVDLEPQISARIIADALAGLHHAHELRDYDGTPLQIIHRDISPHNVFVTYDGQIKLVDFGIAKAALSSTQTEVGVLKGKVAYMAPEQAMGGAIDRRADIFAMGIVIWELLTKKRLMSGESAAATLHRLLNAPIPRVATVIETVDPKLDDIVAKALEKDPDKRFQTAQEMREALEQWINQSGTVVRQEDVGRRVTGMFQTVREEVQKQIQAHMAMVSQAANTQELAALNMDSLRRFGASPTSSGQLMALGVGSGSGSGVVAVEGHSGVSAAVAADEGKKKRGLVLLLLVLLVVFGVVGVLIFRFATVKEQPAASANPTGSAATPTATQPTATQTATAEPTATATHTATAPTAAVTETTTTATTPTTRPTTRHTGTFPTVPPRPTNTASATATASTAAPSATNPDENKGPGFLTLDTYPWTRVSEGGRVLGTTPLIRVPLSPGGHTLLLENPEQGIKQYYSVTIKSGENVSRRLGLK